MENFAKNNFDLCLELFSKLSKKNDKNVIFSPLSIQSCVALAFIGSQGETAMEISKGLKFISNDRNEVAESFNTALNLYNKSDLVKIANKIYIQSGCNFKEDYIDLVKNHFHSEAEEINFSERELAASSINKWVEEKTNDKIKNLISSNNLNSLTRLVLLNAIHFKGKWQKEFDVSKTIDDDFWIDEKTSVKIQMMNNKDKFFYGKFHDLKCSALEMPYKDSELSMLVFLPNERNGLNNLINQLKSKNIIDLTKDMHKREVLISFPKFKVEFSCKANEPLKQMGIKKMFTTDAEFGNLLNSLELIYVSHVTHKAFIEVNEEGTEAAAATGMIMKVRCVIMPSEFKADHPFFYVIWDKKSILITGSFINVP